MIEIRNLTRRRWSSAFILCRAKRIIGLLRLPPSTMLEIVLLDAHAMQRLNNAWRKNNRVTTVLSFGRGKNFFLPKYFLGEIFLCPQEIKERAPVARSSFRKELTRLLLHGILHLVGYNHESSIGAARRMERREQELLKKLSRLHGRQDNLCNRYWERKP